MRTNWIVVLSALLVACAVAPALAGPVDLQQLGAKGPYEVGFATYTLVDGSRSGEGSPFEGRPVPLYVWYPVDGASIDGSSTEAVYPIDPFYGNVPALPSAEWESYGMEHAWQQAMPSANGPFPLLMFSPGWGASAWMHTSVGTRLASHGFVVAVVTHYGDATVPGEPWRTLAVALYDRPRDVSFALTRLLEWNATPGHLLNGLVRPDEVAAGGWSLGGYAAMTLAGGDDVVCDTAIEAGFTDAPEWTCAPTAPDPRIKAIVPLDGSNQCLRWNELGRIRVPVLGMGEEWTAVLDWQARQHAAFSSRPAYRVDVAQTGHVQFADFCPAYQLLTDRGYLDPAFNEFIQTSYCTGMQPVGVMRSLIGKYAAAFLKTNLSGEAGYQPLLTPGWALVNETAIEFFVTERKSAQSIAQEWPELFVYFAHQSGSSQARGEKNPKKPLPVVHLEGLR